MKLSTLGTLVALAALATGCAMQAGQGTDDPGATQETLTTGEGAGGAANAAATPAAKPVDKATQLTLRMIDGKLYWVDGAGQPQSNELRIGPVDPGAPVQDDGDGREPDPHPWHGGVITR